jgi:hypothetical protein
LLGFLWVAGVLGQVDADAISAKMAWYKSQFLWQVPGAAATTWFSLEFSGSSFFCGCSPLRTKMRQN